MLNQAEHYVAWALLAHELDEARDHLESLVTEMASAGRIEEGEFQVQLGHVFAHLNRAWHSRNDPNFDQLSQDEYVKRGQFPRDLEPCG